MLFGRGSWPFPAVRCKLRHLIENNVSLFKYIVTVPLPLVVSVKFMNENLDSARSETPHIYDWISVLRLWFKIRFLLISLLNLYTTFWDTLYIWMLMSIYLQHIFMFYMKHKIDISDIIVQLFFNNCNKYIHFLFFLLKYFRLGSVFGWNLFDLGQVSGWWTLSLFVSGITRPTQDSLVSHVYVTHIILIIWF